MVLLVYNELHPEKTCFFALWENKRRRSAVLLPRLVFGFHYLDRRICLIYISEISDFE